MAVGPSLGESPNPERDSQLRGHSCTLEQVLTLQSSSLHRIPNSSRWLFVLFFLFLVMKQNQSLKNGGGSIPAGSSLQVDANSLRTLPWKGSYLLPGHASQEELPALPQGGLSGRTALRVGVNRPSPNGSHPW